MRYDNQILFKVGYLNLRKRDDCDKILYFDQYGDSG